MAGLLPQTSSHGKEQNVCFRPKADMSERVELSRRTLIWIAIAASEVIAYVIFWASDMPASVRYIAGWYTLVVGTFLLAALAASLTIWLGPAGRLDNAHGWLLRAFLFW